MMEQAAPRKLPLGGILTALGGALAILGSVLTWATVKTELFGESNSQAVSGIKGGDGKITLVLGILLLIAGVLIIAMRAPGLRKGMAILAIIAGLITAGIGAFDIVDIKANSIDQLITDLGGDPETITDEQREQVEEAFEVSVGIGLYLTLAAGIIGLIGGIMSLRRDPADAAALTAPPPPPGTPDTGYIPAQPPAATPPPPAAPPPADPPPAAPPAP